MKSEIRREMSEKYDLVMPFGQWCAMALNLKAQNLRKASFPFDWLEGGAVPLSGYVDIVCSDFSNFMRKENLKLTGDCGSERDRYWDEGVQMESVHDFVHGIPFETAYENVRAKYDRRIARFYARIAASQKVLFVHLAKAFLPTDEEMRTAQRRLSEKFPNTRIDLLVMAQNKDVPGKLAFCKIAEGLFRAEGKFWDEELDERYGDRALCAEVLGAIRMRGKVRNILRKRLLRLKFKLSTCCHLTSEGRRAARQRLFEEATRGGE